jgi:hypothetical protein
MRMPPMIGQRLSATPPVTTLAHRGPSPAFTFAPGSAQCCFLDQFLGCDLALQADLVAA